MRNEFLRKVINVVLTRANTEIKFLWYSLLASLQMFINQGFDICKLSYTLDSAVTVCPLTVVPIPVANYAYLFVKTLHIVDCLFEFLANCTFHCTCLGSRTL